MPIDDQMLVLRLVFAAFYAAGMAAVLRKADIWFPFTTTLTATPGKWVSWKDAIRWALSATFLVIMPALYLSYVQIALAKQPPLLAVHFIPPSIRDLFKFVVVMSLIAAPLGFYDFWQAIMRALPNLFYSEFAKDEILEHYPSAFTAGHGATVAWGLIWIFIPTAVFLLTIVWK